MPREVQRSDDGAADRPDDPWAHLRRATPARIGLTRAGDALVLAHVLELQADHAKARDAVHVPLNIEKIENDLGQRGCICVCSRARDRVTYLKRPDYGRRLSPESCASLKRGAYDAVFIIADGLSSTAVEHYAVAVLDATLVQLTGWHIAPIVVATQARVAIADEIGERLGAALSVILIGERPGLSAADSLGAYITFGPRLSRRDSERNCISNIHGAGLRVDEAAAKLVLLATEARKRGVTGICLKDEMPDSVAVPDGRTIEPRLLSARDAS